MRQDSLNIQNHLILPTKFHRNFQLCKLGSTFKIDKLNRNAVTSGKRKNTQGSMTISFTLNNESGASIYLKFYKQLTCSDLYVSDSFSLFYLQKIVQFSCSIE